MAWTDDECGEERERKQDDTGGQRSGDAGEQVATVERAAAVGREHGNQYRETDMTARA